MTTLQKIIKDAKSLRAKNPKKYSKWTDYVKEASKKYASKTKTDKKKATKRKVGVLKPNDKHKDSKSHNVNIRVVSGVKKKKAAKKAVKRSNTLTKVKQVLKQDKKRLKHGYTLTQGNVKIGVIKKMELDHFNETIKKIDIFEKQKENHMNALKNKNNTPSTNMAYKNQLDQIKKYLKELKIQKSELKKLL
jgi:hypothetical protein